MPAKEYACKVIRKTWLTPTVVELRFEPSRRFSFESGQFVSVVVPSSTGARPLRRAYSLALAPGEGYALCVKVVQNGPGSNYVASLQEGDAFRVFAPYGEFVFDHQSPRDAFFISTGTGLAPFLSIFASKAFRENPPGLATNLFGARTEEEIILPGRITAWGVREIAAISQPKPGYPGFKGRVTDYLRQLPVDWPWQSTDFYVCGNGEMVAEVRAILRGRGVPDAHVHQEIYFVAPDRLKKAA